MAEEMTRLLRKFLGKFVKAKVIRDAVHFTDVDFKDTVNQLPDSLLAVGPFCRAYLIDNDASITSTVAGRFFKSVRGFYSAVVNQVVAKFPFRDPVVTSLGFPNHPHVEMYSAVVNQMVAKFPFRDHVVTSVGFLNPSTRGDDGRDLLQLPAKQGYSDDGKDSNKLKVLQYGTLISRLIN